MGKYIFFIVLLGAQICLADDRVHCHCDPQSSDFGHLKPLYEQAQWVHQLVEMCGRQNQTSADRDRCIQANANRIQRNFGKVLKFYRNTALPGLQRQVDKIDKAYSSQEEAGKSGTISSTAPLPADNHFGIEFIPNQPELARYYQTASCIRNEVLLPLAVASTAASGWDTSTVGQGEGLFGKDLPFVSDQTIADSKELGTGYSRPCNGDLPEQTQKSLFSAAEETAFNRAKNGYNVQKNLNSGQLNHSITILQNQGNFNSIDVIN